MNNTIVRNNKFDLRIRAINIRGEYFDLINTDKFENSLQSVEFVITPFSTMKNIVEYQDHQNTTQRTEIDMSEDKESYIHPDFKDPTFMFNKEFDNIEELIIFILSIFYNKQSPDDKIKWDFSLYIDYSTDNQYYFPKDFFKLIFMTFTGNIKLEGNSNTIWEFPDGDLEIESLIINRGIVNISKILLLRVKFIKLFSIDLRGDSIDFKESDQLAIYCESVADISFVNIKNYLKLGFVGDAKNSYKYRYCNLYLRSIILDYNSDSDRVGKFDHTVKISQFNIVEIVDFKIERTLDKGIPLKIENVVDLKIFQFSDLYRKADKGSPEISIIGAHKVDIADINIIASDTNTRETAAITIQDYTTEFGQYYFNKINITNMNFLYLSNITVTECSIDNLTLKTAKKGIEISNSSFIGELSINRANIECSGLKFEKLYNFNLYSSTIEAKDEDILISGLDINIDDTDINSKSNLSFKTSGFNANEETGKFTINTSTIKTTGDIELIAERSDDKAYITETSLIGSNYKDANFTKITSRESEYEFKYIEIGSVETKFTDSLINNKKFTGEKTHLLIKNLVSGKLTIKFQDLSNKCNTQIEFPETNYLSRRNLEISYHGTDSKSLRHNIAIVNSSSCLLFKCINPNTDIIIDISVTDKSEKQYLFNNSIYYYMDKQYPNMQMKLSDLGVEQMNNVQVNDGTKETLENKLNYGVKP